MVVVVHVHVQYSLVPIHLSSLAMTVVLVVLVVLEHVE